MPAGVHNMYSVLLKPVYYPFVKWTTMLLKVGKLAQENCYLSDSAKVAPGLSTVACPPRKSLI